MTIGKRLRKLRESCNLGQKEIADILGLSDSAYSCYENDIRIPPTKNIIKLAKYYNVTSDYILGLENRCLNISNIEEYISKFEKQMSDFKEYLRKFK